MKIQFDPICNFSAILANERFKICALSPTTIPPESDMCNNNNTAAVNRYLFDKIAFQVQSTILLLAKLVRDTDSVKPLQSIMYNMLFIISNSRTRLQVRPAHKSRSFRRFGQWRQSTFRLARKSIGLSASGKKQQRKEIDFTASLWSTEWSKLKW